MSTTQTLYKWKILNFILLQSPHSAPLQSVREVQWHICQGHYEIYNSQSFHCRMSLEVNINTVSPHWWILSLQVWLHKMDLRVTSLLLVLLALAEATSDRYYHVPKVSKSPYPVKSHGESLSYCLCKIKWDKSCILMFLSYHCSFQITADFLSINSTIH